MREEFKAGDRVWYFYEGELQDGILTGHYWRMTLKYQKLFKSKNQALSFKIKELEEELADLIDQITID